MESVAKTISYMVFGTNFNNGTVIGHPVQESFLWALVIGFFDSAGGLFYRPRDFVFVVELVCIEVQIRSPY